MKRGWDETKSPQWRYLLGQESEQKRELRKLGGEGEIKRNKLGKEKKQKITRQKEYSKKTGREIIYSASPGRSLSSLQDLKHNKNERTTTTTAE